VSGTAARRAGAILVLGLLLVAAVAGASSGTNLGASSLRSGPASDVLSVAVTLGFLLAATAAAVFIWALATRERGASVAGGRERTPFWRRMLAGLFLGLLVGTVIAFAHRRTQHLHLPSALRSAIPHPATSSTSTVHFSATASISTIVVVAVVAATFLAWSYLSARRRGRGWKLSGLLFGANPPVREAAGESEARLAEALAAVRIPDPEEETNPRAAVIAAYVAMTYAAAAAGARRRGDETPSEFLQRLLDSLGASHEAARRLTLLFETARYSTKVFEETRRSDAIEALRQIRAELSPGAVGSPPGMTS
jgi:hypothetical protein